MVCHRVCVVLCVQYAAWQGAGEVVWTECGGCEDEGAGGGEVLARMLATEQGRMLFCWLQDQRWLCGAGNRAR